MARTPPPPRLGGGPNILQRLILFFGGFFVVLTGPFAWALNYFTGLPDPFGLNDSAFWKAWLSFTGLVIAAYAVVTPAAWRFVFSSVTQVFSARSGARSYTSSNGERPPKMDDYIKAGQEARSGRSESTDDFEFDPAAFGHKQSNREETRKGRPVSPQSSASTPRGYEKRDPDDAKFWAVVDDPAASDQERKTALEKILNRKSVASPKSKQASLPPPDK
ncbi:MAG: hypothetical protein IE913_00610 [Halothiobacillus sp.]|nr:hypothetical protein [Halothiobacillus sp.]